MPKTYYRRDLPDGSIQYFDGRIEKPDAQQVYFDDIVGNYPDKKNGNDLEFVLFGKEHSYPNRELERKCNTYILHYVTDGCGTFNGRRITAGNGFLILPDVMHNMKSDEKDPWHFMWIAFSGSNAKWQMKNIGLGEDEQYFEFDFSEQIERLFDDVIYRPYDDCDLDTYMKGVFYIIMSYHKKQYSSLRAKQKRGEGYVKEALRYIDEHYREPLKIDGIAKSLHISRKYLCTLIEEHIGMSTKEYLLNRRADAAADLLVHTGMTVSEIGAEVGYSDYTQFSRMFRGKKGMSPQQYRARIWQSEDGDTRINKEVKK